MKLHQQIQQFKSFFKENILISFKIPLKDTVQPFSFQFQNNFPNESIYSKPYTLSFLNNHLLNFNIPNNLNNLINDNVNNNNNNNDYNDTYNSKKYNQQINLNSSSTSNLKINMIHPIYNTINNSQPLTPTIYYQYLPLPLKYKSKIKSNSSLPDQQQHIPSLKLDESFHSTRKSASSFSKKELQHSISLPNLVSSSSTTAITSNLSDHLNLKHNIVTMDSNNHLNSYDKNNHKKDEGEEEDEISLYSIKTVIEHDQQTLKKLQRKVSVLRKENQDLLDKIFAKRKAKEQKNTNTKLNSKSLNFLTLQQIKIIK